jgi:fucose permease
MRSDLERPLADLGTLLAVSTAGYFFAGMAAGKLTVRFGFGNVLVATVALGTISLLGYGLAGSWVVLLAASVGVGFTGGLVDAAVNAHVAVHHGTRTMNLLHASFGIGATTGPLLVATSLARGLSWRSAFFVLTAAEVLLLATVVVVRRGWPAAPVEAERVSFGGRFGAPIWGLLGIFFFYVGLEVAAAQWSYSLLTQGRDVGEFAAGVWVASYWGGLMGGRLVLGVIGHRVGSRSTLHGSMALTIGAIVVFWLDPVGAGVLGLPILGLGLAGIFPTLVALTPAWVGVDRSPSVIGYQIAASSLGAASLPWVVGQWMESTDLERLGPFLLITAVLMAGLHGVVDRSTSGTTDLRQAEPTRSLPS